MQEASITNTTAWKNLQEHYNKVKEQTILELFDKDPNRFREFSISWQEFLVDYSKNRITKETIELLLELVQERKIQLSYQDPS